MSKVLDSFKDSIVLLWNNKWVLGIILIMNVLFIPVKYSIKFIDNSPFILSDSPWMLPNPKLIIPMIILLGIDTFFMGGVISIVKEGGNKNTDIKTFKTGSKKHYTKLLKGGLIYFGSALVYAIYALIAPVFWVLLGSKFIPYNNTGTLFILLLIVPMGLSYFLIICPIFFFQFYQVGIVVSGYGVMKSYKESFKFVWSRKLSVLSFSIIAFILFNLATTYSINNWILTLFELLVGTVAITLLWTYKTVYYIQAKEDDSITD